MLELTDQAKSIAAIARYIGGQEPPRTPAAVAARNEWQRFYSGLGDWEANYEQQAYDRARNLRLAYNRANAVTAADKAAVEHQALDGISAEEMAGEADRRTADGSYIPPPSGSSALGRAALFLGLGLVAVLFLRK